jgi:transposase
VINRLRRVGAGIDVHRKRCNICIVNTDNVIDEVEFDNNTDGAQLLLDELKRYGIDEVALESTGPYWIGLYDFLASNGINVVVANPLKLKNKLENKTDRIDARTLATLHMLNQITPSYVPEDDVRKLRRLTRLRSKLVRNRTALKNMVHSMVCLTSNEVSSIYTDMFGTGGREMLLSIFNDDSNDVIEILRNSAMNEKRISKVCEVLARSFRPKDAFSITFALEEIERIDHSIRNIEIVIAKNVRESERMNHYVNLLLSIKGVSLVAAASIASEIGDIKRFATAKKLVRYSGLSPRIIQSGSRISYGKLEKMGPPYLRNILCQCAEILAMHEQEFKNHYQQVRNRHGHRVAMVSAARKLLHLIHAMLSEDSTYDKCVKSLAESKRKRWYELAESADQLSRKSIPEIIIDLKRIMDEP